MRKLASKKQPTLALSGNYPGLVGDIGQLLEAARRASARTVNALMTATYWEIGHRIVEFEQGGKKRAGYGEELLQRLSEDLTSKFGRGFSLRSLRDMRSFYLAFGPEEIRQTLSAKSDVRQPAQEKPWTQKLWIYDLRTNKHFTLKENTLKRTDLDDFVACYNPKNRHSRKENERFKSFAYDDLLKRDKVNLDIFWLKDEALEDSANLPAPEIIAAEITEDLEAALEQFATIAEDLKK
jgi:uncharacterized protein DUF1016